MNLGEVCKGNIEAYAFLYDVWQVIEVWDDLHDGDKMVSAREVDEGFSRLFINLPANPFYTKNFTFLQPLVIMMIFNWKVSNELDADGTKSQAYVLRNMYFQLCMGVAFIVGGPTHSVEQGVQIWRDSAIGESLEEFTRKGT